ncbi:MAG: amidohydrolase family protein [bacterium]
MMQRFAVIAAAAVMALVSSAQAQTVLIRGAKVHTAGEQGTLEDHDILIREGRIAALGPELEAPEEATVLEAEGRPVTPGLIASYTHLGLVEISLDDESNDTLPDPEFGLGAALDVQYAINPGSTTIPNARRDGLTRAVVAPAANTGLFAGRGAVITLDQRPESMTTPRVALFAEVGARGARLEGGTRAGSWTVLRESLQDAREYAANRAAYAQARERDQRLPLSDIEALVPVVNGETALVLGVNRAADIREAIRLQSDFEDLRLILLGAREGWRVAEELAESGIPVIIDPSDNLPGNFESLGATLKNAARLHEAGATFAIAPVSGDETHRAGDQAQLAGIAVANGLPWEAALEAVTRAPAAIWGQTDAGEIAVGRSADLVLWDGDPLEVTSNADAIFIRGRSMPMTSRQTELRERYRNLKEGGLPFAYR